MYVPTVLPTVGSVKHPLLAYRGDLKLWTRTALGPYGRAMPRSIGSPYGRCVSLISSDPCTVGSWGLLTDGSISRSLCGLLCGITHDLQPSRGRD